MDYIVSCPLNLFPEADMGRNIAMMHFFASFTEITQLQFS